MNLSAKTLESLSEIITGDSQLSPYRTGRQLIDFFYDFGERDLYGQGFPAHEVYVLDKLKKLNGTETMEKVVCAAFDFWGEPGYDPEDVAFQFNQILAHDGFRLLIEYSPGWMQGNEYIRGEPYFELHPIVENVIAAESLAATSHEAILEQVRKANDKIKSGDFAGAIASAYTLVEELLKHLLTETSTPHKDSEGDIRALYMAVRGPLHLDPSEPGIDALLKPILSGFQKLVAGLYEVANKASDRHARKYSPAAHHAKLAVNSAFALCEFLVDSREYQKGRVSKADAAAKTM